MHYAYQWTAEKFRSNSGEEEIFDEVDRVGTLHPIFVIPEGVAEETRNYFLAKGSF
jgi:protein farnesyltransferase subunit beta